MSGRIDVTHKMLAALSRSDEAALRAALTDTPKFMALGANLEGLNAVLDRIAREPTREMYRQVTWAVPEATADGTRAVGHMPKDAPRAGVVLSFRFDGERIGVMQHQNLPPRSAPTSALKLTPTLKQLIDNALNTRHPMLMAYTSEGGQPVLSFRGSLQVFSDEQLALWVRNAQGGMLRALAKNPKVALMYRDEESKATYQLQGRARVTTDETERQRIFKSSAAVEQAHDFAQLGVAIIIDLDRVEGYAGLGPAGQIDRVLMVR
jgi:hypothetical protein